MKFSVIIPVYNGEKWVARCIESVLNQNMSPEIQIIVVDDGSTDESLEIVRKIAEDNKQLKVIASENKGVSSARNIGLSEAEGEYITFLDADDYIEQGYFEKMMPEVNKKQDIIVGGFKAEYSNRILIHEYSSTELKGGKDIVSAFFEGTKMDVNVWGKLYKREIAKNISFNPLYRVAEDKLYLFECLMKAKTVSITKFSKYHYVINDTSVMCQEFSPKKLDGLLVSEQICKSVNIQYPELSNLAESWMIDVKCRACGELLEANNSTEYNVLYKKLLKEIRGYSKIAKYRYSNKKHYAAYLMTCISPKLCRFVKKEMRMQYK